MGINLGDNTDEYEPEVDTILPRLGEAHDAKDARRIIHQEFVRWFASDLTGPEEAYSRIANEIWAAYERFRATY
jgi:hypothetical protein